MNYFVSLLLPNGPDHRSLVEGILEDILANVARAEAACTRMYDSRTPREDRTDAPISLSKAIGLAAGIGLGREAARLKERCGHIDAVFDAQFRH